MNERPRYGRYPASNPVANALLAIVGALAIGAAIVFGFFIFLLIAGTVALLAGIIGVRIWWVGRKLRRLQEAAEKASPNPTSKTGIIEGEYHVISTRHRRQGK